MLSIVITALNENCGILNKTIKSIIETTPPNTVEIIVIDDYSSSPVTVDYKEVISERNKFRCGVAVSRHIGATLASKKWLLFTDSHMIFKQGWYENFLKTEKLDSDERTIYCGTCLGLWYEENTEIYDKVDLNKLPKYYGARLSLLESDNILEGKWISEKKEDIYEISCLMGAIYFIQKDFFFKIRGLSDLKMWGSDEPTLSLKVLQSGGKILQLKDVQIAHLFRKRAPYTTDTKYLVYNKIRMAKTLLPDEIGEMLINKLPKNDVFSQAYDLINNEYKLIQDYKSYYNSIFTVNFLDVCKKFNIDIPEDEPKS